MVSWNEQAEMKLSVAKDAFVIPRSIGVKVAGVLPRATRRSFSARRRALEISSPGSSSESHDTFDVLICDSHTLQAVHRLDFVHQVTLDLFRAKDVEDIVGIHAAFTDLLTNVDTVTFVDRQMDAAGNQHFLFLVIHLDIYNLIVADFFDLFDRPEACSYRSSC